jgi:predicted dinucleotide-binding enzyme
MKIGLIGAGTVAQAVAKYLVAAGHEVLISNSRGPASLSDVARVFGPRVRPVEKAEAASADIVFLAVPWLKIADALSDLPQWNSRILVDTTNEFLDFKDLSLKADLKGRASSEYVADLAPGALVVKAVNNLIATRFAQGPVVGNLLNSFGFAVIDLGSLHEGGRMQQASGPLAGPDLLRAD